MEGIKGFQKGINNPSFGKTPHNFGKHPSEEVKKKLSDSHRGYTMPKYQKEKISESLKGKPKSKEHIKNMSGEKHHNWKGGKSFQLYGFKWTTLFKHSIRTRDCFTCQVCGKNGWVVHRVDYDKLNCNPDNLVTLCCSCHMKTNFNRDYWKEYFNVKR
jgi:hypothetical protein